jgi:enamine deaminase RidA (YjgF/YER057c/UK114 family)
MNFKEVDSVETDSVVEGKLGELGLGLPEVGPAVGNYVGAVTVGNLVWVSGHGPVENGEFVFKGKLGADIDVETGRKAAQLVILNSLASLKAEIGDLDRVKRVVKLLGMVNCTPEFSEQPRVIDGASDLLTTIFGERGKHARSAVGMGALPFGISVEIEMIVEIE